ncbi:hypothetical protein J1N35_006291 [Gossypium stocksii]|uniref:RNase H type-1 domain-containing protein n=1 Tax=Gossypium stocksii TaxID=47602 RepID=A0A9D3WFH2_9ROSI|nr:hypothetical protein J1N35_006291 [Gossypium stocksii]
MEYKKLASDSSCPRCGEQAETVDPVFRVCPVTVEVWRMLTLQNILTETNLGFALWFTLVFDQLTPRNYRLFCCALWAIWGAKNTKVHEGKINTGNDIRNFVNNYIAELEGLETRKTIAVNKKESWVHPPRDFLKINFDGTFDGKNKVSASRVVVRNEKGAIILACSESHNRVESAFAAKAIACRAAIQVGVENNWPALIIEGDSLTIIKKCKNKYQDRSKIGAFIWDIQQLMSRSTIFLFQHVPRFGNVLAHKITVETLKRKEETYLEGRVPEYAMRQEQLERVREPD